MKKLLILCFILMSFCVFAQSKEAHAIKIYLEDAETGKNINDAKVTLEGFEIPVLTAKYDNREKAYYFDKIPSGYNTVMAYHEKYNEKGFQNIQGLPKELKLKLYTPYRVKIPNNGRNYYKEACYKEDPYRLYVTFNDTISNSFVKGHDFAKQYFSKNYPELLLPKSISTYWNIIIERKDKEKFKRFNDPIIKKLTEDKNILALYGMLMLTKRDGKTYFDEQGKQKYLSKYIKYYSCDTLKDIDYKRKMKKGLLKNNVYKLTDKDIDSISISDQIKIKKGELLKHFYHADTIIAVCNGSDEPSDEKTTSYSSPFNGCVDGLYFGPSQISYYKNRLKEVEDRVTYHNKDFDYRVISSILGDYELRYYGKKHKYSQIAYYWKDLKAFKKKRNLIEAINISSLSQIEQIKEIEQIKQDDDNRYRCYYNFFIYRLRNNIASPFGTTDLIEYYNLSKSKIHQQIE